MKLYSHPFSTAGRPVRLLLAEKGIACEEVFVDLMQGAHHQEPFASLNPSKMVPMLEDDGFRLTESSAILKYLGDKYDLPEYPKPLQARARVNEAMDFLNTQFYRDFGYGVVYPQLFPHHKRRSDEAHAACIEWGQKGSKRWLQVLNDHWLGGGRPYLCGESITLADYLGSGLVSIGELVGCDFGDYPNVRAWLGRMKQLKSWNEVNAAFEGAVAGNAGKVFARV
jgi:glutathione S-transferase